MTKTGTLYVFTGPSGVGKGTVLSALLTQDENIFLSVSATTRAPRPNETEGVSYYFLSQDEFDKKVAENAFLEHASYVGCSYGTLKAPVEQRLAGGQDVILEIEVQGALQVRERMPEAVLVFLAPPSFEELAARLRGRGTEDEQRVQKRLQTAERELAQKDKFDYVVINNTVEQAVGEMKALIDSRRA